MVNVVGGGRNERRGLIESVHDFNVAIRKLLEIAGCCLFLREDENNEIFKIDFFFSILSSAESHLHDVSRMRAIMISVRAEIILLDDGEPSAECRLIAVERIEHVKPPEELEAEKHERSMFGQLLETKDLKVPIEHLLKQL